MLIYRKIKYKDDGRELVTGWQFLTNHVSFAYINAWCTYQMFYVVFNSWELLCPYKPQSAVTNKTPYFFCNVSEGTATLPV